MYGHQVAQQGSIGSLIHNPFATHRLREHKTYLAGFALAAIFLAASSASAQRPYGIDVSHWNGTINWTQVYQAGYEFAFTKGTESPYDWVNDTCGGSWYTDNTFVYNMTNASSAGVLIGCYHFTHPQCNSASSEASGFVTRAGAYISPGYLRPVLDLEDGYSLGATALSTWVNAWMNAVELQTGVEPIVYTNPNYAMYYLNSTVANRDLWIAHILYDPDPQHSTPSTGVFTNWCFWQYSWTGTVPGISGGVDLDVFNGVSSGLQDFIIGGTPLPPPFIVESRSGGQNYANYSETGTWSNGTSKSSAAGCTSGIGHRWCTLGATGYGTATYRFTPTTSGIYEMFTTNCTTSNSGNPMIHKVTHIGGMTPVGICQNTTCGTNAVNVWLSLGQFTLNAGTQYTVTLDGSTASGTGPAGNAGRSDAIKWQLITAAEPPTITQHPSDQTILPGQTATFTVAAAGTGTLTYQWQKNTVNITNGGHYSGCTTDTLIVSTAGAADEADYRCVVTGDYGNVTSNAASLTLLQPGDFDDDTDVDLTDFAVLQNCLGITDASSDPTCEPTDLNADNVINNQDVIKFTGCMSGMNIQGDLNCLTNP